MRLGDAGTGDLDIFLIQVNLSDLRDKQIRERALAIPTAFKITEEDRSLLRQAAALVRAGGMSDRPNLDVGFRERETPEMGREPSLVHVRYGPQADICE